MRLGPVVAPLLLVFTPLASGCGGGAAGASKEPPVWERPGLTGSVRPEMGPPQPGDMAPDFELPGLDGKPVKLSSLRGSWVLLHFTATWCPYCDTEIEHVGKIAEDYGRYGLKTIVMNVLEPAERWEAYAKTHVSPRVLAVRDATGDVARRYAPPRAQPSFDERAEVALDGTMVIDPEGRIRLFLLPDTAHFDPTFKAVRRELERMMGIGAAATAGVPAEEAIREAPPLPPEKVVSIDVTPLPPIAAGGKEELHVKLQIAPGYHVMSDTPSASNYIATRVTLDASEGVKPGDARYPAPTMFKLGDKAISTFMGEPEVRVPIEIAPDASPGERTIKGSVRYQACTDSRCLFPTTRPFEATVRVTR